MGTLLNVQRSGLLEKRSSNITVKIVQSFIKVFVFLPEISGLVVLMGESCFHVLVFLLLSFEELDLLTLVLMPLGYPVFEFLLLQEQVARVQTMV